MSYYISVLLVYLGTDLLAAWGLNLELGVAGVGNFAYIVLVAAGAYTYAVFTLGPSSSHSGFQTYIGGYAFPPAVAILLAIAVSAVLGVVIGITGLRRIRGDYQAVVMLMIAILAVTVVSSEPSLVNGTQGLGFIPSPLSTTSYWKYVFLVAACCLIGYIVLRRFTTGPFGRALRAMRDDPIAASGLGKNIVFLRVTVQVVGGAFAGLSGALLVGFIGAWSPSAWQYSETLVIVTAILVGGSGNDLGVMAGTAIVPVLILQGSQYVHLGNNAALSVDLSWILVAGLTLVFLFVKPQGVFPERVHRYRPPSAPRIRAGFRRRSPRYSESVHTAVDFRLFCGAQNSSDSGASANILAARDLVRHYGGVQAVDGVNLDIRSGCITGLIGPNGAGKTTTLGIISGLIKQSSGQIHVGGVDISRQGLDARARSGLVRTFQIPREFGRMSALSNLLVAAPNQRGETVRGALLGRRYWRRQEQGLTERAMNLLRLFRMEDKASEPASRLSAGQKKMLEVMRALMTQPSILLLDEPMAGLSQAMVEQLEHACLELKRCGLTIVLIEHELDSVERICDSVIVMAQGRVIADGTMSELRQHREVQDAYLVG